eukprot:scaffold391_cov223-Pinguiococcus_pyrenoidosus.AAC.7
MVSCKTESDGVERQNSGVFGAPRNSNGEKGGSLVWIARRDDRRTEQQTNRCLRACPMESRDWPQDRSIGALGE